MTYGANYNFIGKLGKWELGGREGQRGVQTLNIEQGVL